jgi:hypothetical protein
MPIECICMFRVVLTTNRDYFLDLCAGDVLGFLWGTN